VTLDILPVVCTLAVEKHWSRNVKVKICKTIILQVVLYGCETWSSTLWEEHRRRVFENSVIRGIFGPKKKEVTGERNKLHIEELQLFVLIPIYH
jgi:hypothetical protein